MTRMTYRRYCRLLLLVLALGWTGCLSVLTTAGRHIVPGIPRVYSGTVCNVLGLTTGPQSGFELFHCLDLPLSIVADTAFLPYTIYAQLRYGNYKAWCLETRDTLSTEAKAALFELGQQPCFRDPDLGPGELVIECDRWAVYLIREEPGPVEIPLETDGDVADLFRRVTGKKHPTLKGEMSDGYRAFLKRRSQ